MQNWLLEIRYSHENFDGAHCVAYNQRIDKEKHVRDGGLAHLDCLFAILRDFPLIDVAIVETNRQNSRGDQSHTVDRRLNVLLQNACQVILSVQKPCLDIAVFRSREQDVLIVNFYILETSDHTLVRILRVETAGLSPDFECK